MNIINTPFSSKSLYLDTKNANLTSNNIYQFDLDSYVIAPPATKMLITVKECQIVNTFSNIRTDINNVITITGTLTGVHTYTIPEGYYDVETFKLLFNDMSATKSNDIILTYSVTSCKLTFTSLTEDFTFNASLTTADYLGMNGDISSSGGILNMPFIMDFSGLDYVFIKSNLHLRNINNLGITSDTLMRVPLTMPYGYANLYQPNQPTSHLSHERSIGFIQLKITDKEGRILDNQKLNFQITIELSFIYPPEQQQYIPLTQNRPFELPFNEPENKEDEK